MTSSTAPAAPRIAGSRAGAVLLRGALVLFAVVIGLGVAAWYGREPLLRYTANAWIISDQVGRADAVAVFGGGLEYRPFAAAKYYHQGLTKKILISNIGASPAEEIGVLQSHIEANRRVLIKLGVPEAAIEPFGNNLSNTYDEARALREWAERTGARSIIVPTEIFSARRLRWVLGRFFADGSVIYVPALEPREYRREDWWKNAPGLIAFQNEVVKYLYYRLKY
ncbi:MAG: YdcF family protein [Rhizobiales bacterium]|nr:YdcF family protein [Hyphomicrobiales bacterium]